MMSAERFLVRHDERLVQLLDPPFDKSPLDPGYTRATCRVRRENGGQIHPRGGMDGDGICSHGGRDPRMGISST